MRATTATRDAGNAWGVTWAYRAGVLALLIVHAADIHLDSPLRNLVLSEEAQIARVRRATRDAFEALVQLCIDRGAALLLLAGDLYDRDTPNMQTAVFLRQQILKLARANIRVAIKLGNHDAGNRISSALELPDNAHIFSAKKPESVSYDDLGIVVHGQSFKPGPVTENLVIGYPAPIRGKLNIGVLHTSLAGYPEHDPYAPCRLEELTTKGYAYFALGHIHKGAFLAENPWVVYPGNLQGRNAKETGPKGCVVIEADDKRILSVEKVALDVVRWQQLRIDLTASQSEQEMIELTRAALVQARTDSDDRPSAVRVVLDGRTPISRDLAKRPRRLQQTIIELAGEISEDLWLEQIRDDTAPLVASAPSAGGEAASELGQIILETAQNPAPLLADLQRDLSTLKGKLPDDLKQHPALRVIEDPKSLGAAIARLAPRLAARLAGEEG